MQPEYEALRQLFSRLRTAAVGVAFLCEPETLNAAGHDKELIW